MDTKDFLDRTRLILNRLEPSQAAGWEYLLTGTTSLLSDVLRRAVLLLGSESPALVDGKIEDEDGDEGWLVIITDTRLIRGTFEITDQQPRLVVEAVSLDSVRAIRVESTLSGHRDNAPWPLAARVMLVLDREVAGTSELMVPSTGLGDKHLAGEVAALAQRLPIA